MSSVRTSYWSHSLYDSATTARHASSGSSNLRIMSATCNDIAPRWMRQTQGLGGGSS